MQSPPPDPQPPDSVPLAAGVQFKVLSQIFPVLRHEVIQSVANAALAAAMLHSNAPEGGLREAREALVADLENLLAESTTEVRRLGSWLQDSGAGLPLADLLPLCARLLFDQLLRTNKQLHLPERLPDITLPEFSSRYVMLAWLLSLLGTMPDGAELRIEIEGGRLLHARPNATRAFGAPPDDGLAVSADEARTLATHYGWQPVSQDAVWSLALPPPAAPPP